MAGSETILTRVSPQITDGISQTNTAVLAVAPAMAMGNLYQTVSNSVAMAAANSVYAQQQATMLYQTATTVGITSLLNE